MISLRDTGSYICLMMASTCTPSWPLKPSCNQCVWLKVAVPVQRTFKHMWWSLTAFLSGTARKPSILTWWFCPAQRDRVRSTEYMITLSTTAQWQKAYSFTAGIELFHKKDEMLRKIEWFIYYYNRPSKLKGIKQSFQPATVEKLCDYTGCVAWTSVPIPRYSERVAPFLYIFE